MVNRSSDINLVIRAKTEGEKAVEAISETLREMFGNADHASSGLAELGKSLGALDKAYATITQKADTAQSAFERQSSAIARLRDEQQSLVEQSKGAARAAEQLRSSVVDAKLRGADVSPILAQIKQVEGEQAKLDARSARLTATIQSQEAALNGSRSSLQQLGSTVIAVEEAQTIAAARIENTNRALRDQAIAGERVTGIQQRINDLTGVSRPDASGTAAAAASVLIEADNIFRRAEARRAEIQALKDQESATAALADAELAEQANRRRFGITANPNGSQAGASAAVFQAAADDAAKLRNALNPVAGIYTKMNADLTRYRELAKQGVITTEELAAAEKYLAEQAKFAEAALRGGGGTSARNGIFGLRPYELTNLSYQVNDIATQLASGTSLAQTLGQQGGQILQIFPRVGSAIFGAFANPYFLAAAAVVGAIAVGLKTAADQAQRLRNYSATLDFRATGGDYNAAGLAEQQRALEATGASAKDAEAAIKSFLDNGVNPDRLYQFERAAKATSQAFGIELPDAAKQVGDAFTGGYAALAAFDDKMNFLTATEREHIRVLYESGQAQRAQSEGLDIYTRKIAKAAEDARGPWADATKHLKQSWDGLLDSFASTGGIQLAKAAIDSLADSLDRVSGGLGAAKAAFSENINATVDKTLDALNLQIDTLNAAIAKLPKGAASAQLEADLKVVTAQRDALARFTGRAEGGVTNDDPDSVRSKKRADTLNEIALEEELAELRRKGQKGLTDAQSKRREELAGEQAYRAEMKSTGDEQIASAKKLQAVKLETLQTDQQNVAARKAAAAADKAAAAEAKRDREKAIKDYERSVVGAEGGSGKNKAGSNASGYGQFIPSTWKTMFAQVFPDRAKSLTETQILDLRNDPTIAKAIIDRFAKDNARFLDSIKAPVTAQNLYMTHIFGATQLTKALLNPANANKSVEGLILQNGGKNRNQILSQNGGYLRTEGGKGPYRTAAQLGKFVGGRIGDDSDSPESAGVVALNKLIEDAAQKQEDFNDAVSRGVEDQQRAVAAAKAQEGLTGVALIAEQRKQAVAKAVIDLQQRAEDANRNLKPGQSPVVVSKEQIADTERAAAATFDAANAQALLNARLADVSRNVDGLQEQRDILREQADYLRSIGENRAADVVDKQLDSLQPKLNKAIDALIAFYKALSPADRARLNIIDEAQLDRIIAKLELAKHKSEDWGKTLGIANRDILGALSSAIATSFTNFINKVAAGRNVFKSLGESVREFAANFIGAIAQMIIQLLAYAAAVTILRALGVPIPGGGVAVHHAGGIAGAGGGERRNVGAAWFAGAMRYHTGGIAGLAPDEVPAILRRGEEVLTTGDSRHRANGGGSGGGDDPQHLTINNLFSLDDVMEATLRSPKGSKVLLNHVRDNAQAFKSVLS
jgi:hypothetical protein